MTLPFPDILIPTTLLNRSRLLSIVMFSSYKMPSPDATYATHNAPLCQPNGLLASSHCRPWIGDIGYVEANIFVRVFNILLPASDPRQPSELPPLFNPMSSRSKDGLDTVQNSCTGTCCSSSEDGRPRCAPIILIRSARANSCSEDGRL